MALDELRLIEIEARHAACPPGTWHVATGDDCQCMNATWVSLDPDPPFWLHDNDPDRTVAVTLCQAPRLCHGDVPGGDPVATFLVAAHNDDISDLVAEVRRVATAALSDAAALAVARASIAEQDAEIARLRSLLGWSLDTIR